jgi:membrane protease YdiL (CAAX protease family)
MGIARHSPAVRRETNSAPLPYFNVRRATPVGSLVKFFSITYFVTWTCFITAAAISHGTASTAPDLPVARLLLLLLGTFAPSLVALGVTAQDNGIPATQALLHRMFEWHVSARWYLFAIGYTLAIKLIVALVHRLITGAWPRFGYEAWYIIVVAIVISTPVQAGEEIGWRGYALPRLAARFGFARASVLLGVIWAVWHLPIFFVPGVDNYGQSFPVFLLEVPAMSVAITWLYAHTKGSLPLVMLMHSAVNQTIGIVPSAVPGATNPFALSPSLVAWLTAALLWIPAVYFLVRMPKTEPQHARDTTSDVRSDLSIARTRDPND